MTKYNNKKDLTKSNFIKGLISEKIINNLTNDDNVRFGSNDLFNKEKLEVKINIDLKNHEINYTVIDKDTGERKPKVELYLTYMMGSFTFLNSGATSYGLYNPSNLQYPILILLDSDTLLEVDTDKAFEEDQYVYYEVDENQNKLNVAESRLQSNDIKFKEHPVYKDNNGTSKLINIV